MFLVLKEISAAVVIAAHAQSKCKPSKRKKNDFVLAKEGEEEKEGGGGKRS